MKSLLLIFVLTFTTIAQQPDRWRGLIIDESTPEDAIKILGPAKSDKVGDRFELYNEDWFVREVSKKLRTLRYDKIEGFRDVRLMFDDSKLVIIQIAPRNISAQAFVTSYEGLDFRFASEVQSAADFKVARGNIPKQLGTPYGLVAVTDKVILYGLMLNDISGMYGGTDSNRSMPGTLGRVQIASRKLEDKSGIDLLK